MTFSVLPELVGYELPATAHCSSSSSSRALQGRLRATSVSPGLSLGLLNEHLWDGERCRQVRRATRVKHPSKQGCLSWQGCSRGSRSSCAAQELLWKSFAFGFLPERLGFGWGLGKFSLKEKNTHCSKRAGTSSPVF